MSHVSRPGLPPQLDDADWLRRKLLSDGTMGIALELHVTRYQVRKACERHGLEPRPAGRRRGSTGRHPSANTGQPAVLRISERITDEKRSDGPPPTLRLVASRVRAVHDANENGSRRDLAEALVSLASACGLVVDHLQLLEAA